MRSKRLLGISSCLILLGTSLTSCAPAAAPPATPKAPEAAAKAAPASPVATPKPAAVQPKRGGILKFTQESDPATVDPHQMTSSISYELVYASYSGLSRWDVSQTSRMVPDLAKEWSLSADGKTYTFQLREGVKWHDGQAFTSADVKYSLERVKAPPKGVSSRWASLFLKVSSVEAPDPQTFKVTLKEPQPAFLAFTSAPWLPLVPRHVLEKEGQDVLAKKVVGTGAFRFKSYERGVSYDAERFKDYFDKDRPYLDGFKQFIVPDVGSRFAALRTGQLDAIFIFPGITPAQAEEIAKPELKDKLVVQKGAVEAAWYFAMNIARKPWSDVRVRKAVSLLWDRKASIQAIEDGFGDVGAFMSPGSPWSLPKEELANTPGYRADKSADLAEAKKLMADAGYPNGFETTILTRKGSSYEKGSVFSADQLAKIAIKATLNVQESTAYTSARLKREFDTDVQPLGFGVDDPDAVLSITYVTGGGQNYTSFSDPESDRLFAEQSTTLDQAKRKETVLQLQRRLLDQVPLVIQLWRGRALAHQKYVKGYNFSTNLYNNWTYIDVWLDK
ncbi:MAG: hypothetical protein HYX92_00615 [Chloroflexi bacterium]|nr:hypothetical protein [Chloroflexota bacterium]